MIYFVVILIYACYILPFIFEFGKNNLIFLFNFLLPIIWVYLKDINEIYIILFGLFYISLNLIYVKDKKLIYTILAVNIIILILYKIAYNYQNIFINSKNI